MMNPSSLMLMLLIATLCTSGGCTSDGKGSGGGGGRGDGVNMIREDGKTAYMSRREIIIHPKRQGEPWVLAGTWYQNDLAERGSVDPDATVVLLIGFKGSPDPFTPAKESMLFLMGLDGERVDAPMYWQSGPGKIFGVTTSVFLAAFKPETVSRILSADQAYAGIMDTATPDEEGGKLYTKLATFDMVESGAVEALRAFVESGRE